MAARLTIVAAVVGAVGGCQKLDAPAPAPQHEIWEAFYLQGAKIGFGRTTIGEVVRDGRQLVALDSLNHLVISRFGQRAEQDFAIQWIETPDGELLEFKTEMGSPADGTKVTGRLVDGQMEIAVTTKANSQTSRMPWSRDIRGFRAVEQSLERDRMQPSQRRVFKMLMPLVNQVADVELTAGQVEATPVLGIETKLLRVESSARLPDGQTLASTLWVDAEGQTIKTRIAALEQESIRTSRELAMAEGSPAHFDLGSDLIVKVDPPLKDPHETRLVRYRVELASGDPTRAFAAGLTQSVRSLGEHAAEITVRSIRPPDLPPQSTDPAASVDREYLVANSLLQIDDPRVRNMAREGKGNATTDVQVALALERYVRRSMTRRNFTQAFSTAAEVAETHEGDCTEHAVLLSALARACEIPSRVAIGLVYVESADGFGFHMWTEMHLNGQWIPFDATLGKGGTSAAYLKLSDSSLAGASAYSSFLSVAQVVGQLKISVLDAEY